MNQAHPRRLPSPRFAAIALLAATPLLAAYAVCNYSVTLGYGGSSGTLTGTLTDGRTDHGTCPGVPCAGGEVCCYLDGQCFDPATEPAACVADPALLSDLPSGYTDNLDGKTLCGSDADCGAGESCVGPARI